MFSAAWGGREIVSSALGAPREEQPACVSRNGCVLYSGFQTHSHFGLAEATGVDGSIQMN